MRSTQTPGPTTQLVSNHKATDDRSPEDRCYVQYPADDGSKAYGLASRANSAVYRHNVLESSELAERAIAAAGSQCAWKMKTWALCLKSVSSGIAGLHAEALDQALQGLRIAEEHEDHTLISRALCAVGYVAIETKDEQQAQKVLERSLTHAEIAQSDSDLFQALDHLSHVYGDQAQRLIELNSASSECRFTVALLFRTTMRALQVAKRLGSPRPRGYALLNLVNACILDRQFSRAQALLSQCTDIAKAQKDARMLAHANLDAARLFEFEGNPQAAIALIRDPAHLKTLCVTDDLKLKSQDFLAHVCDKQRYYRQAFDHLKAARDIERKINADRAERHAKLLVASIEMREARANAESFRLEAQALEMRNSLLQQEGEILRRHAMFDALTGVGNRRAADAALKAQVAAALTTRKCFLVAYLDIDHFKSVNDEHGHQIGDMVLQKLGQILRDNIRPSDQVFRFGGEEFVLILADQQLEHGEKTCERLRQKIRSHAWGKICADLSITGSFGLAKWANEPNEDAVMARADRALYLAKDQGRDRVEVTKDDQNAVGSSDPR